MIGGGISYEQQGIGSQSETRAKSPYYRRKRASPPSPSSLSLSSPLRLVLLIYYEFSFFIKASNLSLPLFQGDPSVPFFPFRQPVAVLPIAAGCLLCEHHHIVINNLTLHNYGLFLEIVIAIYNRSPNAAPPSKTNPNSPKNNDKYAIAIPKIIYPNIFIGFLLDMGNSFEFFSLSTCFSCTRCSPN